MRGFPLSRSGGPTACGRLLRNRLVMAGTSPAMTRHGFRPRVSYVLSQAIGFRRHGRCDRLLPCPRRRRRPKSSRSPPRAPNMRASAPRSPSTTAAITAKTRRSFPTPTTTRCAGDTWRWRRRFRRWPAPNRSAARSAQRRRRNSPRCATPCRCCRSATSSRTPKSRNSARGCAASSASATTRR